MIEPNPLDAVPGGLPRNFLRPCLLLLIAEEDSYGYDLLERLERLGLGATDPGGLYRALRAMEKDGMVDSNWEVSDVGPARRIYRLTEEGQDWLHLWVGAMRESRRLLGHFVAEAEAILEHRPVPAARDGMEAPMSDGTSSGDVP